MGLLNSGPSLTCPPLPTPLDDAAPIKGSLTFHQLSIFIAGVSMGVACLVSLALIFLHALHLSRPAEQIKIIRITALIPAFAIIQFINIYLGTSAVYLVPWMNVCESIALVSFFLLLCAYLSMSPHRPGGVLEADDPIYKGETLAWNRMIIIRALSAAVAVVTVLRFTKQLKSCLARHRVISKLVAFKLIILLNFIQRLVFSFAGAQFNPSTTISYLDLTVSLPAIIFCLEMVIFSAVFHFVYSYTPYLIKYQPGSAAYHGGLFGLFALGTAFSPFDIVRGITAGF